MSDAAEWVGAIGQILGAAAAATAAAVALRIASKDREDRADERDSEAFAQARLVLVRDGSHEDDENGDLVLKVPVTNLGDRAILQVDLRAWRPVYENEKRPDQPPWWDVIDVIRAGETKTATIKFNQPRDRLVDQAPLSPGAVYWEDASGRVFGRDPAWDEPAQQKERPFLN